MIQRRCFAFRQIRTSNKLENVCIALRKLYCSLSFDECPFYKTTKQLFKEQELANQRLYDMRKRSGSNEENKVQL